MTVKEAKEQINESFRNGEHEMEAGYPYENQLNDRSRQLIAAMAGENGGECWLWNINLYKPNKAQISWKWDGGLVYNFGAKLVSRAYSAELERLIRERDETVYTGTAADYELIKAIYALADSIGAEPLFWN